MRRSIVAVAAAAALIVVTVGAVGAVGSTWKAPPFSAIGIATVGMIDSTFDEDPSPDYATLSVWVDTGSASQKCLATLNENLTAPAVDQLYCSERTVTFADGSVHAGLYLHLMAAELPADTGYWVNVYQEGARFYGTPRKCDLPGCNS